MGRVGWLSTVGRCRSMATKSISWAYLVPEAETSWTGRRRSSGPRQGVESHRVVYGRGELRGDAPTTTAIASTFKNSRNGYWERPWDTRVGTIDLKVPKLRSGVYSPEFLLQPRRRAEQALVAVVCQAYVEGVSTRRVDDLVKAMGIEGISRSEVSRMAVRARRRGGRVPDPATGACVSLLHEKQGSIGNTRNRPDDIGTTASNFIRLPGVSALLAGVCYVLVGIFHPPNVSSLVTSTRRETVHVLACAMCFFGMLGMAQLCARQAGKLGGLVSRGSVVFSPWLVLIMGLSFVEAAIFPRLATDDQRFPPRDFQA